MTRNFPVLASMLLLGLGSTLTTDLALAQTHLDTRNPPPEIARYELRQTDEMPNPLAFYPEALSLQRKSVMDPDLAAKQVAKIFGATDPVSTFEILEEVAKFLSGLDAEYEEAERGALCGTPSRVKSRDFLYRALDDLEDARQGMMLKHYEYFVANLTEAQKKALAKYLEKSKKGQLYIALDHKAAYESTSFDIKEVVTERCNQLGNENSPITVYELARCV